MSDKGAFVEQTDKPSNRPAGRPRRSDVDPGEVKRLRETGRSLREIARELRAGYGTVRRLLFQTASVAPDVSQNPSAEAL